MTPNADYVRQLEDAVVALWQEMPTEQVLLLRAESPALVGFVSHVHHAVGHEQAMVRRSMWASQTDGSES